MLPGDVCPYAHPQYAAFILILTGFLIQWPTLLTVVMYPVLLFMYIHLAGLEEKESLRYFGRDYKVYMESVPKWGVPFRRHNGGEWFVFCKEIEGQVFKKICNRGPA